MAKYLLYVLRWTVLAVPGALFFNKVREIFGIEDVYLAMVVSQALMGAMVYFIDRLIFSSGVLPVPWEVKPRAVCTECGRVGKCYRIAGSKCCEAEGVKDGTCFRCEECAIKRMKTDM
ncbi:MAG TPA: hypothetical protein VGJ94_08140 [Syntrophorhabdaceae bacterium]